MCIFTYFPLGLRRLDLRVAPLRATLREPLRATLRVRLRVALTRRLDLLRLLAPLRRLDFFGILCMYKNVYSIKTFFYVSR